MVWFRVDDGFCDHPKVEALLEGKHAGDAIALWTLAGSWCAKQLTNGEISTAKVARLGIPRHAKAAAELVRVRLWEKTATGFRFHAWEERQSSREEVEQARAAASERMRRIRASQRGETANSSRKKIHESGNVRANNMRTDLANIERSSPNHDSTSSSTHTIPFHSVPIRTKEENQNSALGDSETLAVDSSFSRRAIERVVSEARGTPWKVPINRYGIAQRADEVAESIREMAAEHDIDCEYLCKEAFTRWVQAREKRKQDTTPHLWLEDWAGALPPPPKPKESYRDLEG